MHLELITPDQTAFDGEVNSVTVPGAKGSFQILKNHAPIVSALSKGSLIISLDDGEKKFMVDGGVVEVLDNHIIVLAESIVE
ncbi:ATP synthase F1 subunit epsilon [Aureibacter tunicatorum]|uniref:F-type H+-transporting ATPase subunit epsilon n=1 Tax=Aureibacter tunicatorum TaxID=866807 RepID=A0AAE4BRE0_9BACT|nr:ATP synthase F1 subunit epsilon [Aureibacter tunicatorum]MDR6240114.1 F-type H+-transporting ATPase subunit epsilon [Aureibacter tunicatorum]BDD06005.1 hypothetical protein AUTU_34880 [Aureibacter tunicatorum]